MNVLLLRQDELRTDGTVRLEGRRARHAREVLRVQRGDCLRVGVLHGLLGTGEVLALEGEALVLAVRLDTVPPPRAGVDLVLAMPRPKALKRLIPALASLGLERVWLVNAARVEKSYFDAKALEPAILDELLALGLEQARDTRPPRVELRPLLRPFVEDELAPVARDAAAALFDPSGRPLAPGLVRPARRLVAAIGPEGGWTPFELELLGAHGFERISLGPRVLRVETAVPYVLGALAAAQSHASGPP